MSARNRVPTTPTAVTTTIPSRIALVVVTQEGTNIIALLDDNASGPPPYNQRMVVRMGRAGVRNPCSSCLVAYTNGRGTAATGVPNRTIPPDVVDALFLGSG